MSVSIACPGCKTKLRISEELLGKRGKCPTCGERFIIPDNVSAPRPAKPPPLPQASETKSMILPATERQKEFARELGIEFDESIDRRQISRLIDKGIEKRDRELCSRVDELEERKKDAWLQMREDVLEELLEEETFLSKATTEEMMTELNDRGVSAILIKLSNDAWDAIEDLVEEEADISGLNVEVVFTEDIDEPMMRRVIKIMGASMLTQDGKF